MGDAVSAILGVVYRWQWVLLAVAAPFLLFPTPTRSPVMLIVPGVWVAAWLAGYAPLPRTPLNGIMLLLSIMVLVSLWATYDLGTSLGKVSGMVLGLGVFYAFVYYGQRIRGWVLSLVVFLAAGLGIAAFGLLGIQWLEKVSYLTAITSRLPRIIGGLPGAESGFQPNEVAGALLWVIPPPVVLSGFVLARRRWLLRLVGRSRGAAIILGLVGASVFLTFTFLLTQSRGGYLALAVTGFLAVVIAVRAPAWRVALVAVALVTSLLVALQWNSGAAIPLPETLGGQVASSPAFSLDSLEGRVEVWSRAIYGIQDFPFTGMGMNTFRTVVHVLYPLFLLGPDYDIGHAHNEFLQAALDLGIPGLVAFVSLYLGAWAMLREIWQRDGSDGQRNGYPSPKILALGLGGGLVAHLLYGLTDAVALGAKPGILFWMLLGLIAALYRQKPDERGQPGD